MLELDDYVATRGELIDLCPMVREDRTFEGQVFGIPIRTNSHGSIVIRPSKFEAAGLPPEPPSNWSEFNELALYF